EDTGQTAREVPEVGRALVAAVKEARRRQRNDPRSAASRPVTVRGDDGNDPIVLPRVTASVGVDDWEARPNALGGTTNTLAAGFTAKLGDGTGFRHDSDGTVCVQLIVNDRIAGDTRAIAVSFARVRIDPTAVTTDLRGVRADIKQALNTQRD